MVTKPDVADELGKIIHGRHFDADEARNNPELFRARMDGVTAANRRWNLWLQRQGYTSEQATYIISKDMEDAPPPTE